MLDAGEPGFVIDKAGFVIGDGVTDFKNLECIGEQNGIDCQKGLKGYYWFYFNASDNFVLSSTQMFYTPVEEVPYQVGDVLSFSDESNCFINCFKISSIVNNVIYVESIGEVPPLEDIRNKITEDYEHLYVCDFAVWCLNKPMIGSVNIGIGATALGVKTTARGTAAEASGYLTNAIAPFSSASGLRTTASGERSHTEGSDTIASASCAHAEGYQS